ncbi:MAG: transposase [Bacilli bacterium]|nr:transposase [Bacilli bacterium]
MVVFQIKLNNIKYVCRYISRPVMAKSRIIDYDGTFVTFWYQRHEDNLIIIEKVHAYEFISRLIIHIPDYNSDHLPFLKLLS